MRAQQDLTAMLEYLGVAKRICLYLARINPQQTIDHLVYEVSRQQLEDEGPAGACVRCLACLIARLLLVLRRWSLHSIGHQKHRRALRP